MFVAFIDESGNDSNSTVFTMASLLLCDLSSYYFANGWSEMLSACTVADLDVVDAEGGEHRYWAPAYAANGVGDLIQVLLLGQPEVRDRSWCAWASSMLRPVAVELALRASWITLRKRCESPPSTETVYVDQLGGCKTQ
jgi:hypothetical protein